MAQPKRARWDRQLRVGALLVAFGISASLWLSGCGPSQQPVEAAPQSLPTPAGQSADPSPSPSPSPTRAPAATSPAATSPAAPTQTVPFPDLARRVEGDPLALGRVDAPLVLIEFADFRCPYCGVFARETKPALVEDYVNQGLLRIEWHDAPIFGEQSIDAAVAARAAGQQGQFWSYYDALFAYDGRDHQELSRERLVDLARQIGLPDLTAFETALDDPELRALVQADYQQVLELGIYTTPTFLIGQTPITGAQPLETFRQAIETEKQRAGVS